jgi:3-phenylpropionate/cinnamic acid dioxygenase small subunit
MRTTDDVFGDGLLGLTSAAIARLAVVELYDEYNHLLDNADFDAWLQLFTEDCDYRVVARENLDQGLPLATMRCESRAMLADRISAIRSTQFFLPRIIRRFISGLRVVPDEPDVEGIAMRASFLMVESTTDAPTRILLAGEHRDVLVVVDGRLRFSRKLCVYDSPLVPTSLIHPV